jgi:ribosomal protein L32E
MAKFLRTGYLNYSKLGKKRKKKLKYLRARGRDSKIRLKMKGHLRNVDVGFRSKKNERNLIRGLVPIRIFNLKDLDKINKGEIAIIAKISKKKKIEISKYALEKKIILGNLNPNKFLEENKKEFDEKKKMKKLKKKNKEEVKKEENKRENEEIKEEKTEKIKESKK